MKRLSCFLNTNSGVSLIELMVASLILIGGILPLIWMFANVITKTEDVSLENRARVFAQDLMEEIIQGPCNNSIRYINTGNDVVTSVAGENARRVLYSPQRAWDEFNGKAQPDDHNRRGVVGSYSTNLGPEPGEDHNNRLTLDDIDDYNGFRETGPFHDIYGKEIPGSQPFEREVLVFYVNDRDFTQTEDPTNFKRIDIRVNWREGGRDRFYILSTIRAYYP
ncbi:MAG: hypothetical protein QME40_02660 [bacterium]|nr:hypothetical protein [bacterium]